MGPLSSAAGPASRTTPALSPTGAPPGPGPDPGGEGRSPLTEVVLFLYVPFLAAAALAFASTPDDPLITLRYAANLVHGEGAVFNPGQHVQGFTSPLHLLVAVVLYLVPGGHDLFKLKLASLVFGFLAVREGGRLMAALAIPRWARRTGFLAVGTSSIVAFAAGNGLETTLAMWLLTALARRLVVDGPRRSPFTLFGLTLAAVLARPDALLAIVFMAAAALVIERPVVLWRRAAWFGGAVVAAGAAGLMGALYFGNPLPNTYFAKEVPWRQALTDGRRYIFHALQPGTFGHAWGDLSTELLIGQGLLLAVGTYTVVRRFPRCGYLLALGGAQTLFILKSGGDWMVGGRFVAPAVIPLIVVEMLGLVGLATFGRRHARPGAVRATVVVSTTLLVVASVFPFGSLRAPAWQIKGVDDASLIHSGDYRPYSRIWSALPGDVRCLRAGQLVATSEVGYLGFARLDLRVLDLRGLTNRAIAMGAPASLKGAPGVIDPGWIRPSSPVGRVILADRPALIASFDAPPHRLVLGGAYRLTKVTRFGALRLSIYVPARSSGAPDSVCSH